MDYPIWSLISKLPKPIRDHISRYRNWLNENFDVILQYLPEKIRIRVNKVDFVEFATLKLVYDIPRRSLRTINKSLDLLQPYDIPAISITGEIFQKNSESFMKISRLVEALTETIKEHGFDFIITSKDLIELANKMARSDYG
jgi:hypothetical protein